MAHLPPVQRTRAASSFWNAAISVLGQTSQQLSSLVLALMSAAILTISDYGLFMLAIVIVEFVIMLAHAGFYSFLINARTEDEETLISTMFWTLLGVGLVGGGMLWLIAPQLEQVFKAEGLAWILKILAILQPFGAIIAWVTACLIRAGHMRTYYWSISFGSLSSLALGVLLLLLWESIVALIVYRVLRVAINLALYLRVAPRAAGLRFDMPLLKDAWLYARGLYAARLADYLSNFGADLLLAFFFTTAESGLYRIANRLAVATTDILAHPLRTFATRSLAQTGRHRAGLTRIYSDYLAAGFILIGGVGVVILTFGGSLVSVTFHSDYVAAVVILQLLAVRAVIIWPASLLEPLLAARHQTEVAMTHSVIWLTLSITAIYLAAPHGLQTLAWVQTGMAGAMSATALVVAIRYGGMQSATVSRKTLRAIFFLLGYGAVLTFLWRWIESLALTPLAHLIVGVSLAIVIAALALWRAIRRKVLNPNVFFSY